MICVDIMRPCLRNKSWHYNESCHLFSSDGKSGELILFAIDKLKLKASWKQNNGLCHFNLTRSKRALAIKHGAKEINRDEFVQMYKKYKGLKNDLE